MIKKLKFQSFIINFFCKTFFTYLKMSKNSSAKYHQDNKERLQIKLMKNIKVFRKKKKGMNDIKSPLKTKSKN